MQRLSICSQMLVKTGSNGLGAVNPQKLKLWSSCPRVESFRTLHAFSPNVHEHKGYNNTPGLLYKSDLTYKLILQPHRHAGHSKWSNIKHTKMAKDAQKDKAARQILREITVAVKEGGGTDPTFNTQLRRIFERAKAMSVPKATIETYMKNAEKNAKDAKPTFIECRGPFGSAFIVEAHTPKLPRSKQLVQAVLKKYGATCMNVSGVLHSFENKGIIEASAPGDSGMTLEKAEEIAIDIGAEEVTVSTDISDDKSIFQFICDVGDFNAVKKGTEENGLEVSSAYLGYIPTALVDCPAENVDAIIDLIDALGEIEDVVRVYDNFKLPS